jgi:predicted DNA-binding protein with PD1-like motif
VHTDLQPAGTEQGRPSGRLIEGPVFPTLEVVVTENPAEPRKVMHPELGIALIDLERSGDAPD